MHGFWLPYEFWDLLALGLTMEIMLRILGAYPYRVGGGMRGMIRNR